jgi:hypothetical protein
MQELWNAPMAEGAGGAQPASQVPAESAATQDAVPALAPAPASAQQAGPQTAGPMN